jgi:hypothetical protein
MYRDDAEAAQLRIRTLEAKLAERDASLAARDAEIAELQGEAGRGPRKTWPRVWPVLLCMATGAIGLAAGLRVSTTRATGPSTGIAACDLYLERLETCVVGASPAAVQAIKESTETSRKAMVQAATMPAARESLRTYCGQAVDRFADNPACKW